MSELVVLGNCATQTADCEATNFVVRIGDANILFDAGPGVVRQLYRAGFSASDIDLVVVTHCHADHSLGVPYLLFTAFVERSQGKTGPGTIPILALPEVYDGLMATFAFCYPPGRYPMFEVENWRCSGMEESHFKLGDIEIRTAPVTHAVPTVAVRFDSCDSNIVLSSDTVYDKRLVYLARNVDVLVHEAFGPAMASDLGHKMGHGIADDAARAASDAGAGTLVLCHWMAAFKGKSDALIEEAKQTFDGVIKAPKELERLAF